MKIEKILLVLIVLLVVLWFCKTRKEGYSASCLSNLSGTWNVYDYTGYDFKNHPKGTVQITDSGGDSFDIILQDGRKRTAMISSRRTDKILSAWVGPVGQMTKETIAFTFYIKPDGTCMAAMEDDTNPKQSMYILSPK